MGFFVSTVTVDWALDLGWIDSTPVCFLAAGFLDAEDVCGFIFEDYYRFKYFDIRFLINL